MEEKNTILQSQMQWEDLLNEKRCNSANRRNTKVYDKRSEFQKDFHRIIGSASFRRLQDKTQVFPLDKSDFIRTRLTHSLEVSSFAKSLGQSIFKDLEKEEKVTNEQIQHIVSILECAGLLHDIGNPPFGHFGEESIRDWFKENLSKLEFKNESLIDYIGNQQMINDLYNFEGNAQALRLLTKLHFLVDNKGMHLTYALLNTLIKYPVSSLNIDKKFIRSKKMGYYYAEEAVFNKIMEETKTNCVRHPLTYILEAADDIAYRTADIEDALKKGLVSYNKILKALENEKYTENATEEQKEKHQKAIQILQEKYSKAKERNIVNPQLNAVQNWIVWVQGVLIGGASETFKQNYESIMRGDFNSDLLGISNAKTLASVLGDLAFDYVFNSKQIITLEISASIIIQFLLNNFIPAIIKFDTEEKLTALEDRLIMIISDNYKQSYKYYSEGKSEEEKLYLRLLLVTDFICGMTDSYAKNLYQELNGV